MVSLKSGRGLMQSVVDPSGASLIVRAVHEEQSRKHAIRLRTKLLSVQLSLRTGGPTRGRSKREEALLQVSDQLLNISHELGDHLMVVRLGHGRCWARKVLHRDVLESLLLSMTSSEEGLKVLLAAYCFDPFVAADVGLLYMHPSGHDRRFCTAKEEWRHDQLLSYSSRQLGVEVLTQVHPVKGSAKRDLWHAAVGSRSINELIRLSVVWNVRDTYWNTSKNNRSG